MSWKIDLKDDWRRILVSFLWAGSFSLRKTLFTLDAGFRCGVGFAFRIAGLARGAMLLVAGDVERLDFAFKDWCSVLLFWLIVSEI